jgi:hypothetical protein
MDKVNRAGPAIQVLWMAGPYPPRSGETEYLQRNERWIKNRIQSGAKLEAFFLARLDNVTICLAQPDGWSSASLSNQGEKPPCPFAAGAVWLFGFGRI